jgi:hypothetical protein
MKKFIIVALLGASALFATAATPSHYTSRGINGTWLCVSNSQTVSQTSSNAWYFNYAIGTNVNAINTNSAGAYYSTPLTDLPVYSDAFADVSPNLAIQVIVGFTNSAFYPPNFTPTMANLVWTNPSALFTNGITQTNTLTISVFPVSSSEFGLADTYTSAKSFTFTVYQTNQVGNVLTTNLPTSLLQGASALRWSVANGAQAGVGQGCIINAVNIVGWKP